MADMQANLKDTGARSKRRARGPASAHTFRASGHVALIATTLCAGMSGTMYKREDLAGMMDKLGDMGMGGMGGGEGMEGMPEGDTSDDVDESAEKEEL